MAKTDEGAFICVIRDIPERKQRQEELQETTRLLRDLPDAIRGAIWVVDAEGRYRLITQRAREILELDTIPVVGRTMDDLLSLELAAQFRANNQTVFDTESPVTYEEVVPTHETERAFLTRLAPLCDSDGDVYAVCGIVMDITESKEQELRTQRRHER